MSKRNLSEMDACAEAEATAPADTGKRSRPAAETHSAAELTPEERRVQRRYLLFVEYNGHQFSGSQRQIEGVKTVQEALENAFKEVVKEAITVHMSSRTDAGVHALANSAHVHIIRRKRNSRDAAAEPFPPETLQAAVNYWLKKLEHATRITHVRTVRPTFNARHHAAGRTYVYRIACPASHQTVSIFDYNTTWAFDGVLDVAAMRAAAALMLGRHDFSSFRAAGCQAASPVRTLEELEIQEGPLGPPWAPAAAVTALAQPDRRSVVIRVRSRSFLYHQVRLMVGWLVHVGSGKRPPAATADVIAAQRVAALGCKMAPSWGLFLAQVHYDDKTLAVGDAYNAAPTQPTQPTQGPAAPSAESA